MLRFVNCFIRIPVYDTIRYDNNFSVYIAEDVFLLERGQTNKQTDIQTDATEIPTHSRLRLSSQRG